LALTVSPISKEHQVRANLQRAAIGFTRSGHDNINACRRNPVTGATRRLFLSLAAALAPAAAIAHRGWGGYDPSESFTVTGEILKSTYEKSALRDRDGG
jgi:hypothetical protein